jgi:serine/threonine-protein phosphatase 2B catalytic subunit
MSEKDEESKYQNQMFLPNVQRNCSYKYSYNAVSVFLKANNLLCILRAHEAEEKGFKFYKTIEKTGFPSVITVFSAPNYCDTYGNAGAVLQFVNNDMNVKQFKSNPHPMVLPNHQNVFGWSIPFVSEKICDIMYGILSQCPIDEEQYEDENKKISEESINSIRAKIVSLGRVSKMYNTLRQERESWLILKGMLVKSGTSHHLLLTKGPGSISKAIESFQNAKEFDDDSRPTIEGITFEEAYKPQSSFASNTLNSPSSENSSTLSPTKVFTRHDSPIIKGLFIYFKGKCFRLGWKN